MTACWGHGPVIIIYPITVRHTISLTDQTQSIHENIMNIMNTVKIR